MRLIVAVVVVLIAAIAAGFWLIPQHGHEQASVPLAAPVGVTFQTVKIGTLYADSRGMTLYISDKDTQSGKSACDGDCAKAWSPLTASAAARPFADWSIDVRDGGVRQWALNGKPLYTSALDKQIGETKGNGIDNVWHLVVIQPGSGLALPYGLDVQESAEANGQVLVDAHGMPLYGFDGDAKDDRMNCGAAVCDNKFSPLPAAEMVNAVGDFSVIARSDATMQWAYKGKRLYTYSGDVESGDANGRDVDSRFQLAMVVRYFIPAEVKIASDQRLGGVLTDAAGMTLYVRDRFRRTAGGHNTRAGARGVPADGRMIGLSGCDAQCEQVWHPFHAPAGAEAAGYWSVAARPDGTKQWVYKGYALYTYANDHKRGDMTGQDVFDYGLSVASNAAFGGAPALYWHIAAP